MTGINQNTSSTTAGRDAEGGKTGWPKPATSSSLVTKGKEGGDDAVGTSPTRRPQSPKEGDDDEDEGVDLRNAHVNKHNQLAVSF